MSFQEIESIRAQAFARLCLKVKNYIQESANNGEYTATINVSSVSKATLIKLMQDLNANGYGAFLTKSDTQLNVNWMEN